MLYVRVAAGIVNDGVDCGSAAGATLGDVPPAVVTPSDAEPGIPENVAVMVAEPAPTADTSPADDTVAIAAFELAHDGVPLIAAPLPSFSTAVACVVCPTTSAGDAKVTVTVGEPPAPATENAIEPVTPSLVAEIMAVPPATADTSPDVETVATLGAALDQVMVRPVRTVPWLSLSVATTCIVWPTVSVVPVAVSATDETGATGLVVTVKAIVPLLPSLVAVTVALPAPTAVI
jgi:hypothetical protein